MQGGWSFYFPQLTSVLSFSCSCLVSFSPSEVGYIDFECCPVVQELTLHSTTCPGFEVAYCCVCSLSVWYWDFSSLPYPLSLGRFSVPCTPSTVCVWLKFTVFQFSWAVWFLVLLSGSRDQVSDPLPALLWRIACCLLALSPCCLSCVYLVKVWCWKFSSFPCLLSLEQVHHSTHSLHGVWL
jgi:hypothetical protein